MPSASKSAFKDLDNEARKSNNYSIKNELNQSDKRRILNKNHLDFNALENEHVAQFNDLPSSSKNSNLLSNESSQPNSSIPISRSQLDANPFYENTQNFNLLNRAEKLNASNEQEEFKRYFKQLIDDGFNAEQVRKALSISNNKLHLAKEILLKFAKK